MPKTLIEELPRIAAEGRREAQQMLDRLSGGVQIGLQTNELVLPARDTSGLWRGQTTNQDLYQPWYNRLVYGDNMLAMQALLKGDPSNGTPSLRGSVDLIYIDPPFDSKADYRTKITLPDGEGLFRPLGERHGELPRIHVSPPRADARIAFRERQHLCAYRLACRTLHEDYFG